MLGHALLDAGIAVVLERMQRPAGHSLVTLGRGMQQVGREVEHLGHELIRTALAAPTVTGTTKAVGTT